MHHSFKMSYLEPILVHPVRRQNFGDTVAQTCNPHLIPCPMKGFRGPKIAILWLNHDQLAGVAQG